MNYDKILNFMKKNYESATNSTTDLTQDGNLITGGNKTKFVLKFDDETDEYESKFSGGSANGGDIILPIMKPRMLNDNQNGGSFENSIIKHDEDENDPENTNDESVYGNDSDVKELKRKINELETKLKELTNDKIQKDNKQKGGNTEDGNNESENSESNNEDENDESNTGDETNDSNTEDENDDSNTEDENDGSENNESENNESENDDSNTEDETDGSESESEIDESEIQDYVTGGQSAENILGKLGSEEVEAYRDGIKGGNLCGGYNKPVIHNSMYPYQL